MFVEKKIAFYTLGCKVNYSETSFLSKQFEEGGFSIIPFNEPADVYVINTCAVTHIASKKSRNIIQKAIKMNPDALIVITGCMADIEKDELRKYEKIGLIVNTKDKFSLVEKIKEKINSNGVKINKKINSENSFISSFSYGERTRSFIKIQDGCDYFCSYCVVPHARGRSRSDTIENILKNIEKIDNLGVKEIILTGINIGDFKSKKGEKLIDLLKQIDTYSPVPRIRLSSIEPDLLDDDIIRLMAQSEILMPHLHIPLQSGSDKILKLMNRRYDTSLFRKKIEFIKEQISDCCIATDIITGFPGESDTDFETTFHFLKNSELSYFHVFTYSERKNTKAFTLPDKIPYPIKKQRTDSLLELSESKKHFFYNSQKGKQHEILFESDNLKGYMYGFTKNYIRVKMAYDQDFENKIFAVPIIKKDSDMVFIINKEDGQIK